MRSHAIAAGRLTLMSLLLVALCSSAGWTKSIEGQRSLDSLRETPAPYFTPAVETLLGAFTFDDGASPDPQGWTVVDRTAQDRYFHIDDFAGLAPDYTALAGTKSLWCGTATEFATPGYGNGWQQAFNSSVFNVAGDVTVEFLVSYDTEANYDVAYLEFDPDPSSGTDTWQLLQTYTGGPSGTVAASEVIPAASLPLGEVRLRFRFTSDGGWSDEDNGYNSVGAIIVDDLSVSDDTGTINYQDFESDAVGEDVTADGTWSGYDLVGFGAYAALHDGAGVLQQTDPNPSHLWGFFDDPAVTNYGCGGYPAQGAVPYGNANDGYIDAWIRSPAIPFIGTGDLLFLEFDVYLDLPQEQRVYYTWHVRFFDGVSWTDWVNDHLNYFNPTPAWMTHQEELMQYCSIPEASITHVQVALGVKDLCPVYPGDCLCHSNGPLFDNITVKRTDGTVAVAIQEFDAVDTERGVDLSWQVYADEDVDGFEVSRLDVESGARLSLNGSARIDPGARRILDADVRPATTYEYTLKVVTPGGREFLSPPSRVTTRSVALALGANVPNPFNPATTIRFTLDRTGPVSLAIYDVSGRLVRTVLQRELPAGRYSEVWDGTDDGGRIVPSGVYFYRITAGDRQLTRKMVLMK